MKITQKFIEIFENHARRQTLTQLQAMSNRQLEDCGFSAELVQDGMKGWPWRLPQEESVRYALDPQPVIDSVVELSKSKDEIDALDDDHVTETEAVVQRSAA